MMNSPISSCIIRAIVFLRRAFYRFGVVFAPLIAFACVSPPRSTIDWERAASLSAAAGKMEEGAWTADLAFLVKRLESTHPKPWHSISKQRFLSELHAAYKPAASACELGELRAARLLRALALIGEGHTSAYTQAALSRRLPIHVLRGADAYYVAALKLFSQGGSSASEKNADAAAASLYGAKLVSLNGKTIEEVEARLKPYISAESEGALKIGIAESLVSAGLLLDAGIIEGGATSVECAFTRMNGTRADLVLDFDDGSKKGVWRTVMEETGIQSAESVGRSSEAYWWRVSGQPPVAYFQYNACRRMEERPFAPCAAQFFAEAAEKKAVAMIIDLRNNGGGDSSIFTKEFLPLLLRSPYTAEGKLYVLIGPGTFSSGVFAINELDRYTSALFVGESAGQGLNHYGYTAYFMLPSSGFVVSCSTTFWRLRGGEVSTEFSPDIFVPQDPPAIFAGHDPAFDTAMALATGTEMK